MWVGWGGRGPVQERWCRPGEAQILVSSSRKLPVSAHSCSGRKVQSVQMLQEERVSQRGEQGLNNGESLLSEPVIFLEAQDRTAGSHFKKKLQTAAEPVPTSLKKSYSPRSLLGSVTTNSSRKPPLSSPAPLLPAFQTEPPRWSLVWTEDWSVAASSPRSLLAPLL